MAIYTLKILSNTCAENLTTTLTYVSKLLWLMSVPLTKLNEKVEIWLTCTIRPITKTIATQDTISAWFWIMNSWLKIGGFLLELFLIGLTILMHYKITEARDLLSIIESQPPDCQNHTPVTDIHIKPTRQHSILPLCHRISTY